MGDLADPARRIDERDRPRDAAVAELAARQHGLAARRQLVALGLGRGAIERRLARGRLLGVHRGVFAVGHPRLSGRGWWIAATLACGDRAPLSHQSAGALWEFRASASASVDVTTQRGRAATRDGIRVHHARRLDPEDGTVRDGIAVTTVARTLLDLAETLSASQLRRGFEEADRLELIDMGSIEELMARARGTARCQATRRAAVEPPRPLSSHPVRPRTPVPRAVSQVRPPPTQPERPPGGLEVDALWGDERLVVELDGFEFHRGRAAFGRDRQRDAALQMAGYRVLRVTHRRLQSEPGVVIETVRALLADSG
jgi:hypothetical protein